MARALLIELAGQAVAIPADGQRCEVLEAGGQTALPVAAPLLLGLTVIHGRAVPVVNLLHLLAEGSGVSAGPQAAPALTVFTETQGEALALPADRTLGLISLPEVGGAGPLGAPLSLPAPDGSGPVQVRPLNPPALLAELRQHLERV